MTKPAAEASVNIRDVPTLAGIHYLKPPMIGLARSCKWFRGRLGYEVTMEFVEQGKLMGYALEYPPGACGSTPAAPGLSPVLTTSTSAYPPRRPSMSWPPADRAGQGSLQRAGTDSTANYSQRRSAVYAALVLALPPYERGWRHAPIRDHSDRSAGGGHRRCPVVPAWSLQSPR